VLGDLRHLGAALVLAACTTGALAAETSYVPLPEPAAMAGAGYSVQVTVTNRGSVPRTVEAIQMVPPAQAAPRRAAGPSRHAVGAGRSIVLAPEPAAGFLEVTGPAGVTVGGRLLRAGGGAGAVELPAMASDAVGAAGETLSIQGLRGSATRRTDVVVVNLGRRIARCDAVVRRSDGSAALDAKGLALTPRAPFPIRDVFGRESLEAGAAEITCDAEFLAFAQVHDSATGELAIVKARRGRKGPGGPAAACAPSRAGSTCFAWPGVVHTATEADPVRHIYPPVAPGTYGAVHLRLEVQINGWNQDHKPNAAHGILYFVRNNNREMWASLLLRPLGILGLRHGFFKTHGQKAVVDHRFRPEIGRTYEFDYLYDTRQRRITLRVLLDGKLVHKIQQRPDLRNVTIRRRDKVWIGLSNPGLYKPEPYSRGWVYSNLLVEFL
jgi:hypothetical protein